MRWLSRWLNRSTNSATCGSRQASARIRLETLEDRCVPTVTFHGGALLNQVEAQPVFLGSGWNSTLAAQTTTLTRFVDFVAGSTSPFLQTLNKAGYNVGTGSTNQAPAAFDSSAVKSLLLESDIQKELQAQITRGNVATPDANRLYIVFVQSGVAISVDGVSSKQGLEGYHGAMAGTDKSGKPVDIHYAVIAYPGNGNVSQGHGTISDITATTSHELAEAVTDPNVNYKTLGWYDDTKNGEIGDITENNPSNYVTMKDPATGAGYLVQLEAGINDQPLPLVTLPIVPPSPVTTPVSTTLTLTPSSTHITAGHSINLTITATSSSGTATGTVDLFDGTGYIGRATLGSDGTVTIGLVSTWSSAGVHKITARYNGVTTSFDLTIDPAVLHYGHYWWW